MNEQPEQPDTQDADDIGPGTQPVDFMVDSSAQSRPIATQAIFRPDFDDDDDDFAMNLRKRCGQRLSASGQGSKFDA